ncbi:E3 SUMO-protein ligase PIAS2-like [Amblyomma americanum]
MFPYQPFYRSVYRVPLRAVVWPQRSHHLFYSGGFDAGARGGNHTTLLLVHFELYTERSTLDSSTASMSLNGKAFYGLPFTIVNITPVLSQAGWNAFAFWSDVIPRHVTVNVDEVEKISEDELLLSTDESSRYVLTQAHTEALLRCRGAQAEDVIAKALQVSLLCPLKKSKMKVPCRGVRCRHAQCFDAYAYLTVNECTLQPRWRCPVCSDLVLVHDIRVDLFTLDILNKVGCQCDLVVLQGEGNWQPLTSENDQSVNVVHQNAVNAKPFIDLTADSDTD